MVEWWITAVRHANCEDRECDLEDRKDEDQVDGDREIQRAFMAQGHRNTASFPDLGSNREIKAGLALLPMSPNGEVVHNSSAGTNCSSQIISRLHDEVEAWLLVRTQRKPFRRSATLSLAGAVTSGVFSKMIERNSFQCPKG